MANLPFASQPLLVAPSWRSLTVFTVVVLALVSVFVGLDIIEYLPIACLASGVLFWSIKDPLFWVFGIILAHILILRSTEGITIAEIVFGLYYFGTIAAWFVVKFLRREKVLTSSGDQYLFWFVVLCFFSLIPALLNGASFIKWLRELIIFLAYLLYFPLKSKIKTENDILVIILAFVLVALYAAVNNFINYTAAAKSAVYAWELLSGRQPANEPLFMTSVLVGLTILLHVKSFAVKTLLTGFVSFFFIALLFTFSRGYWMGFLIGMGLIFYAMEANKRNRVLIVTSILVLVGVGIVYALFSYLGSPILKTVASRLLGTGSDLTKDPSLKSRFVESGIVWDHILENPVLGNGLGALFTFHDPLREAINRTWYIHNGYLFLWFKLGAIGLFCYLALYLKKMLEAFRVYRSKPGGLRQYLSLGMFAVLGSMLVVSITSPQFITRDSILIIILCWSITDSLYRNVHTQAE